jgi:bis(5'-nucleosyl)-tetraphosphatase (symmetrical)
MRWIVGDIHGCAIELDRMLSAIRFDPSNDELWSVGDLVNTGPDSLATLRLWRDAGGKAVLGNHDIYALRVHDGARKRKPDTLDALLGAEDKKEHLGRLRSSPILIYLEGEERVPDLWIVHAGLRPEWSDLHDVASRVNGSPHDESWLTSPWVSFATRVRCCTPDGEMDKNPGPPQTCRPPFQPWDRYYRGRTLVVHGHWAYRGFYRDKHTMGLDSGCVYGGKLTAWCQEEDRVVQVPSRTG